MFFEPICFNSVEAGDVFGAHSVPGTELGVGRLAGTCPALDALQRECLGQRAGQSECADGVVETVCQTEGGPVGSGFLIRV